MQAFLEIQGSGENTGIQKTVRKCGTRFKIRSEKSLCDNLRVRNVVKTEKSTGKLVNIQFQ